MFLVATGSPPRLGSTAPCGGPQSIRIGRRFAQRGQAREALQLRIHLPPVLARHELRDTQLMHAGALVAEPNVPLRSIRDWYGLSETLGQFYSALPWLDGARLIEIVQADINSVPRGRLRTRQELEPRARCSAPALGALASATAREQTLQWMFIHRGYFAEPCEGILLRELPTCCAGEMRQGSADLLAYDQQAQQPILIELKRAAAGDPLTRCVLEVLWRWTFAVQHLSAFEEQLAEFGCTPVLPVPRLAIAAPETFFREGQARSKRRNLDDYAVAQAWIDGLDRAGLARIDLYAIEDGWQAVGPNFLMRKVELHRL